MQNINSLSKVYNMIFKSAVFSKLWLVISHLVILVTYSNAQNLSTDTHQLWVLTADSLVYDHSSSGLSINVNLKNECVKVFNQTGKVITVDALLKKLNEIVNYRGNYSRYYNGQKEFFIDFEDLLKSKTDSTFYYWDTIKKLIRDIPHKTIYFYFNKVDTIPEDFWKGMGELWEVDIKVSNLCYTMDLYDLDNNLQNFGFMGNDSCSSGKLIIPKVASGLTIYGKSLPTIETHSSDSVRYYNDIYIDYSNLKRLKVNASILHLQIDTPDILLGENVLSYPRHIILYIPYKKQKIRISSRTKNIFKNSSIVFMGGVLLDTGQFRVEELNVDPALTELSNNLIFQKINLNAKTFNKILINSKRHYIKLDLCRIEFNMETISLLKKVKKCELSEVKIINNTHFSLPEIKKQLPNCTFN